MTPASTNKTPAIVRGYVLAVRTLAGVFMAMIVGIMIAQVIARYVVGDSLIWAEELCRYLLIWQTFLVLGLAYTQGEFVALDFLPARLPPRAKWILSALTAIPVLFFLGLMAWHGYDFASRFDRQTIPALDFIWETLTGSPLGLSIRWVYVSVTVGLSLMSLHVLADLAARFRSEFLGNAATPDMHSAKPGDSV